nr:hypothetical protein [Tanacetum cinerariifolium]
MDQQDPTVAKIQVLDTRKFEQWQFRIQQYLQHEHYALWEVIEFGDSYTVPASSSSTTTTDTTSGEDGTKSGRTVTLTAEDMHKKKKNDVNARITLLLSFLDEHQLRFSQLQFMDIEIEHDDLNQKFLTSSAPEWLMHTIVWRNRTDLDTMSLDDLYNHLKMYESEVQKKSQPNSQNMAFISSVKHISENEDGNTACVPTASTNVPTASASVATISQDTSCAYITSQSSGSQIKFEDINQIDEDDIEEMDIKWNMALLKDHALVADEVAPTEFALMANTSAASKVFDNSLCSKDLTSPHRAPWVPTVNSRKFPTSSIKCSTADMGMNGKPGNSQNHIDDKGYWDSGCSRHMTGNISYLTKYEPYDGGVLFTDLECIVLGRNFKLTNDANVLLKTLRQHNMYTIDLNNIVPHKDLTCLVAKASAYESMLWHMRLGKQHKASCKTKLVNSVTKPLHTLHMDLFGPTS